jgi:glycosyltransferase involved in cell wall biosynthesis
MLTSSQMAETISAVVVALNEGEMLQRTVENLFATLPRTSEIIVVDDGSADGSTAFL